jgi:hypothetical protein
LMKRLSRPTLFNHRSTDAPFCSARVLLRR